METPISEYGDGEKVEIETFHGITLNDPRDGHLVVRAFNQGGYCSTAVDLLELLQFVKVNLPDVWKEI